MDRPAEKAKLWYEYRPIFVSERRIREGTEFWVAHRQDLDRASIRSGVAPEYLAAILGVETYYGRLTGNYRVLDALATLAFDYPPRAKFFRDELEQFLLLTRDFKMDPVTLKGSYAGAMGAPQFMPSNYRRYAVDADADGRIDLWSNWSDVCASVGNYLKEHGWNAGEPVLAEASVDADKAAELDGRKLALDETVGSLQAKGVSFETSMPPETPAMLIAVDEPDGVHWRVGYNNFYVITRYNHSALYAMAVYDLAVAVRQQVLLDDAPHDAAGAAAAAGHRRRPPHAAKAVNAARRARYRSPPRAWPERLLLHSRGPAPPPPHAGTGAARPMPPAAARDIPDAVPRYEPRSAYGNPPFYDVFGKRYFVLSSSADYIERGVASWYGPGFHKVRTSTGETLRHVRHDRGSQDVAAARLRARHQLAERPQRRGARQRSRSVRRQPHHRSVLHRRRQARHAAKRHRHGRSAHRRAGERPGRCRGFRGRAAASPPRAARQPRSRRDARRAPGPGPPPPPAASNPAAGAAPPGAFRSPRRR